MYQIQTTAHPYQVQYFKAFGSDYTFTLRYNTISKLWNYDLFDNGADAFIVQSLGLGINAPTLVQKNLPFVIMMFDESGLGIDSTGLSDMGTRLGIYLLSKEEFHEAILTSIQS